MNELEKQKQIVALLEHAIFNIKYAATEEQKITHKKMYRQSIPAMPRLS